MKATLILLPGLLWAVCTWSAAESPQAPATIDELEHALQVILTESNTPSLIGAVVVDDTVVWEGALGIADRATGRPVSRDTLFRVGSITKTFTSLAVLILAERGILSLETVLRDLVPEAGIENPWQDTDPVRLYHVLEHTAGFDDIHLRDYAYSNPEVTLLEGIRYNTTSRVARWRPGTRMAYSNMGPAVAALAVETFTGERFEDFTQREIFAPLNMRDTTYLHDPRVAASYASDGVTAERFSHITARPSGAVSATASDMARLLRMFIARGATPDGQLISVASLERMERPRGTLAAQAGMTAGYGLGNTFFERDGFHYQGHGGGIDGFRANFGYLPAHDRGYFFAVNGGDSRAFEPIDATLRAFLTRDLKPPPAAAGVAVADASGWSGYYQPDAPRNEMLRWLTGLLGITRVEVEADSLLLTPAVEQPSRWIHLGDGMFRRDQGSAATLAVVTSPDGDRLLQGEIGTLRQIPAALVWLRWLLAATCLGLVSVSLLLGVYWLGLRLLLRRSVAAMVLRMTPPFGSLCLVAAAGALVLGMQAPFERLAVASAYSRGYQMLTWMFATATIAAAASLWHRRARWAVVSPFVRGLSIAVVSGHLLVLGFFSYHGMIGLRLWAY